MTAAMRFSSSRDQEQQGFTVAGLARSQGFAGGSRALQRHIVLRLDQLQLLLLRTCFLIQSATLFLHIVLCKGSCGHVKMHLLLEFSSLVSCLEKGRWFQNPHDTLEIRNDSDPCKGGHMKLTPASKPI